LKISFDLKLKINENDVWLTNDVITVDQSIVW